MIYAILTVWLVFGMFLAYCIFYFQSSPAERVMTVILWPFLLAWAIICLIGLGISTIYKAIDRDLAKDEP